MQKLHKYLAVGALLAVLLPGVAFAHGSNKGNHDGDDGDSNQVRASSEARFENRFHVKDVDDILDAKINRRAFAGTVTAIGSASFTLKANDGTIYTVNTANAQLFRPFNTSAPLSSFVLNDQVWVKGALSGSVITAATVFSLPANTQPAKAKGTITAVNGSTLTLQTKNNNVVTVSANSNTSVTKADGTAGTMADVTVGSQVKIKGLWDSVLNVLNAIKIKLHL